MGRRLTPNEQAKLAEKLVQRRKAIKKRLRMRRLRRSAILLALMLVFVSFAVVGAAARASHWYLALAAIAMAGAAGMLRLEKRSVKRELGSQDYRAQKDANEIEYEEHMLRMRQVYFAICCVLAGTLLVATLLPIWEMWCLGLITVLILAIFALVVHTSRLRGQHIKHDEMRVIAQGDLDQFLND